MKFSNCLKYLWIRTFEKKSKMSILILVYLIRIWNKFVYLSKLYELDSQKLTFYFIIIIGKCISKKRLFTKADRMFFRAERKYGHCVP